MIDENAAWMPAKPLRDMRRALNNPDDPSPISREWELAVLYALSKIVEIEHEPDLGKRPDVVYRLNGETVIADVVTVSDRNIHLRNPAEELEEQFRMRLDPLLETGIKGGFCLSIAPRNFRMQKLETKSTGLHIPPIERFEEAIFNADFDAFLDGLRANPHEPHSFHIRNAECNLQFSFHPKSSGWTLDKYRYTQSTMLRRNPVWYALNDKRRDLEQLELLGHRGIILCDGDCETLRDQPAWDHYGIDDIIRAFLCDYPSIEFVLTLTAVHDSHSHFRIGPLNQSVVARLMRRAETFPDWLVPIRELCGNIPPIRNTAQNARYEADFLRDIGQWHQSPSFRGGCTVSDRRIRISSRDLLQLLAGVLRQEHFERLPFMARCNPFLQKLAQGRLITGAAIERGDAEADDDWIVFEFGNPDPASTAYRSARQE